MQELQEEGSRAASLDRRQLARLEDADYESQPVLEEVAFFSKGRDLQSTYVNHKYTEAEREVLGSYDSTDYLPPHSQVRHSYFPMFLIVPINSK